MRLVLAAAACLLLAACNGGASGQARHSRPLTSASAIGKAIGCQTPLRTDQSFAQVEKHCKVDGKVVSIIRSADRDTALQYVKMGSGFGASYALINDNWMIASTSRPLVSRLAKRNGWDLQ